MATRKGMMLGKGRGYKNVIGKDPMVHKQSAMGMKQPQSMPIWSRYSMKNKKMLTKDLRLKDSDRDGVANVFDCQPHNKKHQDDMPVKEIGEVEKKIDDKIENPKTSNFKDSLKKAEEGAVSFFKKEKKKLGEYLEKKKLEKHTKELNDVRPEEVKKLEAQEKRVAELKRQITEADDVDEIDKLSNEYDKEKEELRNTQEKITEINLEDYSDSELKTLAIKTQPDDGLFSFFSDSNENQYEKELIRRERRRAEVERREYQVKSEEQIKRKLLEEKLQKEQYVRKAELKKEQSESNFFDDFFTMK